MNKIAALAALLLGLLAFVAAEPLQAGWCPSPGGGGAPSGGGSRPGSGGSSGGGGASGGRGTSGTIYTSGDFGGTIKWIDSLGQTSPVMTGVPGQAGETGGDTEIFELKKACEERKPILVFFSKPKDLLAFGDKAQKDPEVDACDGMDQDIWKRIAITERSKEFVCIRVNVRKADHRLLGKHRVGRAPVVSIYDYNLRELYFSSSPKLAYGTFGKIMETHQMRVEGEIKKIAQKTEDTPEIALAKKRAQVIEQRELYKGGLDLLDKKKWEDAEAKFNKAIEIPQDADDWKKQAQVGLIEVKAGKLYEEADKFYTQRRFKECKEICDRILKECKEAKFYTALVQELKTKVDKKLS